MTTIKFQKETAEAVVILPTIVCDNSKKADSKIEIAFAWLHRVFVVGIEWGKKK